MDSVAGTSFTGNDFESVDSMSLARENVTIAEDTQDSNPPQLDDSYSQHQLHVRNNYPINSSHHSYLHVQP